MRVAVRVFIGWTGLGVLATAGVCAAAAGEATSQALPYKDDPAVVRQLASLGAESALWLEAAKVDGLTGQWSRDGWLNRGPFTRGYCNKMAYAPERQTAFYCGQDHNLPHYTDAWEYHLGSNTWHCLSVPDGGNQLRWRNAYSKGWDRQGKEKEGERAARAREVVRAWFTEHATLEGGYPHTKVNGGPVMAWHTWDALTWDPRAGKTGRWFWAVLDDQATEEGYLRSYCTALGRDYEAERKNLKPGMGLWSFDPTTRRWARWTGEGSHPRMRGMGGSLIYLPDLERTIWYCGASNVAGGDHQMWAYDAAAGVWTDLKPNDGKGVFRLVVDKQAPSSEVQMAYSPRHGKLVAVLGPDTFVYDVKANVWLRATTDPANKAHDNHTVFAYDSVNDVFLLLQPARKSLRAYTLASNTWRTLEPKGGALPERRAKGYYDPVHNVFAATDVGKVWVYRHGTGPAPAAPSPPATPEAD
jgi:hypothetical protein